MTRNSFVRWALVVVLCLGTVLGIGFMYDRHADSVSQSHITPAEAADQLMDQRTPAQIAEAEEEAVRDRARAICDKEDPIGSGTVDEEVEQRMVCLARNGYR